MDELRVREATPEDRPPVLGLLSSSLGWVSDDRHAELFAWKHDHNPFGSSWAWVAEDPEAGVVGVRMFLRWRFDGPEGVMEAVRAVDTATAPTHRGAGIFSRLTRHGLDQVTGAGTDFVFNTPNDQSLPGYLKLGWEQVGRLPVNVRPASLRSLPRVARSRVPADLWSQPSSAGQPAHEVLDDPAGVASLLSSQPRPGGLTTERSLAFLRWRYGGFEPLHYRAVLAGSSIAEGVAVFRVRQRGAARECALADVIVPGGDPRLAARLARRALAVSGADYLLALGAGDRRWPGFLRTDRLGPLLTWRAAARKGPAPSLPRWSLALGDVELF